MSLKKISMFLALNGPCTLLFAWIKGENLYKLVIDE